MTALGVSLRTVISFFATSLISPFKHGHRRRKTTRAGEDETFVDLPGLLFLQTSEGEGGAVGGEGEAHPAGVPGEGGGFQTDDLDVAVFDVVPDVRKLTVGMSANLPL